MKKFFNVGKDDRVMFINSGSIKVDLKEIAVIVNSEDASLDALTAIDSVITSNTECMVFKRDLAMAKAEGKVRTVTFDCKYQKDIKWDNVRWNYLENAQCLLNKLRWWNKPIRLFAGIAASSYLKLITDWSSDGREPCLGIYREGTIHLRENTDLPIYKVSTKVLPANILVLELEDYLVEITLENMKDFVKSEED